MSKIPSQWVHDFVDYNPETGKFTRKAKIGCKGIIGDTIGYVATDGYYYITINKYKISGQRLAWFIVHGEWPYHIDHINGNKADNRICNLRPATKAENGFNAKIRKDNKTGVKGIVWEERANGFQARVAVNRKSTTKRFLVKKYGTTEAALEAAKEWVTEVRAALHGEFAHNG